MTKSQLLTELAELKHDKSFGILTRPALEIEHRKQSDAVTVIFLDLDHIHNLNEQIGHEAVNRRIKKALRIRSNDIVLTGRWYSGDEIVLLIKGDVTGTLNRLQNNLTKNGLSATIATAPLTKQLHKAVDAAKSKVEAAKAKNNRGQIVR